MYSSLLREKENINVDAKFTKDWTVHNRKCFKYLQFTTSMNVPSGLDLGIIVSVVTLAITALGAFFYWKGRLDEWKEGMNDWKEAVNSTLDTLKKDIRVIMVDIGTIRTNLEKDVSKDGMMQRQSPVVLSEKAMRIEEFSLYEEIFL